TGGLRYWKDGRDVPDVMLATMDYPDFTLRLRVNFKSSEPQERFGFQFVGSEGTLTTSYNDVLLARRPRETEPGYTIETFPEAMQKRFLAEYHKRYPQLAATADGMRPDQDDHYVAPREHDAHLEHHRNFLTAVRTRKPFLEDGVFGLRAAGPALLTNTSYYEQRVCHWDSEAMTAS
ncbi:MAG: gfo/Idh/MocA family oxidoreductase, partial [bacterium]